MALTATPARCPAATNAAMCVPAVWQWLSQPLQPAAPQQPMLLCVHRESGNGYLSHYSQLTPQQLMLPCHLTTAKQRELLSRFRLRTVSSSRFSLGVHSLECSRDLHRLQRNSPFYTTCTMVFPISQHCVTTPLL